MSIEKHIWPFPRSQDQRLDNNGRFQYVRNNQFDQDEIMYAHNLNTKSVSLELSLFVDVPLKGR